MGQGAEAGQAGLAGDVAHRAAFGSGAEQGALRPALYFHPVEVEHRRQGVVGVQAQGPHLDRGVVDIDPGGARPCLGADAADRDVLAHRVEGDPGRVAGQFAEGLDPLDVHLGGGEGADAEGHLAQVLLAPAGGDHDLLHRRGRFGGLGLGGLGGGRPGAGERRNRGRKDQQPAQRGCVEHGKPPLRFGERS